MACHIKDFMTRGKFMIGLLVGLKPKLFMNGSIRVGVIGRILIHDGILGKNIKQEKKWNSIGRSIIGESKMKFLLYISLLLSLLLIVMGTVLAIYNHSIFAIYVVFGLILFILILMVVIND